MNITIAELQRLRQRCVICGEYFWVDLARFQCSRRPDERCVPRFTDFWGEERNCTGCDECPLPTMCHDPRLGEVCDE